MDRCAECGFEYQLDTADVAGEHIEEAVAALAAVLLDPERDLSTRPSPETWSPLEYACHVRDVLLVQRERVILARWADTPSFPPMGRDERVEFDGYREQDPGHVARQLTDAAAMFANVLQRLDDSAWDRTAIYNYPQPTERSLRWIAVHTQHEAEHHLRDVSR